MLRVPEVRADAWCVALHGGCVLHSGDAVVDRVTDLAQNMFRCFAGTTWCTVQVVHLAEIVSGPAVGMVVLVIVVWRLNRWRRMRSAGSSSQGPQPASHRSKHGKQGSAVTVAPGDGAASGPVDKRRVQPVLPAPKATRGADFKFTAWHRRGTNPGAGLPGSSPAGVSTSQSPVRRAAQGLVGVFSRGSGDGAWVRAGESVEVSTPHKHTTKGTSLVKVQPASGAVQLEREGHGTECDGPHPEELSGDPRQRQSVIGPSRVRLALSTEGVGGVLSPGGFKLRREGSCASQVTPQTTSMPRPGRPPITIREDSEGE